MVQEINDYPALSSCVLFMGYDNGIINRCLSESEYLNKVNTFIGADGVDHKDLKLWDDFLSRLTDAQLTTIAGGEESEVEQLIMSCPNAENSMPF